MIYYIKKICILVLFISTVSNANSLMDNFALDNDATKNKTINDIKIKQSDFIDLKNKPLDELSIIESYLLGLWYYGGSKELNILVNKNKSMVYLKDAFSKGYTLAAPHYISAAFEINKSKEAFVYKLMNHTI